MVITTNINDNIIKRLVNNNKYCRQIDRIILQVISIQQWIDLVKNNLKQHKKSGINLILLLIISIVSLCCSSAALELAMACNSTPVLSQVLQ